MSTNITPAPTWTGAIPCADDGEPVNKANRLQTLQPMVDRDEYIKSVLNGMMVVAGRAYDENTTVVSVGTSQTLLGDPIVLPVKSGDVVVMTGDARFVNGSAPAVLNIVLVGFKLSGVLTSTSAGTRSRFVDVDRDAQISLNHQGAITADGNLTIQLSGLRVTSAGVTQKYQNHVAATVYRPVSF